MPAQRISKPPVIDGVLDDGAWSQAARAESFIQWSPVEGASETEKTVAHIGYDDAALYVAFEAFDSEPSRIRATLAQREQIDQDDLVWISLDTFNDQRRGYEFICNPLGVQWDVFMTPHVWDASFDTVWHSMGRMTPNGYIVEMAIPFKSLRFPKTPRQDWGLQMHRNIRRKNEHVSWAPVYQDRGAYFYQMGLLTGLEGIHGGRNVEMIPELTALKSLGDKWKPEAGVSLKYSPQPNLSADATINPDFSQIELDPVRLLVNLRYPVFIPEKRPFFLERADIFATPIQAVNTRSIITPSWGAKITGQSEKLNFGLLAANDRVAAPSAQSYIGRLNLDVHGQDTVGLLWTDRESGGGLHNRVVGGDGNFRFRDVYSLRLQGLTSFTRKASGAKDGSALYLSLNRNTRALDAGFSYEDYSANFEGQAGFVPRVDYRKPAASLTYRFYTERPRLTYIGLGSSYARIYEPSGTLVDENPSATLTFSAPGYDAALNCQPHNLERYGGVDFRKNSISLSANSAPSKFLSLSASAGLGEAIAYQSPPILGNQQSAGLGADLKPWQRLKLSTTYFLSRLLRKNDGAVLSEQGTLRQTVRVQCSRELSLRLIADWTRTWEMSGRTETLIGSFLTSYVVHPGTALFVGYDVTGVKTNASVLKRTQQTFFTKLSWLFRL